MSLPLKKRLNTEIVILPENPGEVPEYECREAATYVHVSWREWLALEPMERAQAVAHYRLSLTIKAHVEEAASAESERQANRRKQQGQGR